MCCFLFELELNIVGLKSVLYLVPPPKKICILSLYHHCKFAHQGTLHPQAPTTEPLFSTSWLHDMDNIKEPKTFFRTPFPPVYQKHKYFSWRLPKVTAQPANRAHHVLIGGAKVKVGLGGDPPNHKEVNKEDMEGSWSRHQDLFFPLTALFELWPLWPDWERIGSIGSQAHNWGAACFLLKLWLSSVTKVPFLLNFLWGLCSRPTVVWGCFCLLLIGLVFKMTHLVFSSDFIF